ncbi:MAG: hypothetical protein EZS28_004035 [Streblomastix strix]|uniref:Uncharacterized protein n=1 Tax=Streblomastix strix TaxID=222440 RepID=A0A5J4X1D9_9EUKA|nr:MAG: hypothetical protein EZS28_004035 [Streblomastix strix]
MLFIFAACWACVVSILEGYRVLFDEFYKHVVDLSVITANDHDVGPNQLPETDRLSSMLLMLMEQKVPVLFIGES